MRRSPSFSGQQVDSAVRTVRPVALDSAMAGRAGSQDFSAAARAEDKVLLNRRAAVRARLHPHLGFSLPVIRVHWFRVGVMGVVRKVGATHRFYLRWLVSYLP